ELGGRFVAGASLYAFNASNVNSVRAEGMLALGLGVGQIESLVTTREINKSSNSFYRSPGEMAGVFGKDSTPPAGLGADAVCLHLIVNVRQGSRDYRLDAWVSPAGTASSAPAAPGSTVNGAPSPDTGAPAIPAKRTSTRNKVDSPFQILELRENNGT